MHYILITLLTCLILTNTVFAGNPTEQSTDLKKAVTANSTQSTHQVIVWAIDGCTLDTVNNFSIVFTKAWYLKEGAGDTIAIGSGSPFSFEIFSPESPDAVGVNFQIFEAEGYAPSPRYEFFNDNVDPQVLTVKLQADWRGPGGVHFFVGDSSYKPLDSVDIYTKTYWNSAASGSTYSTGWAYLYEDNTHPTSNYCAGNGSHTFFFWRPGFKWMEKTIDITTSQDTTYIFMAREPEGNHVIYGTIVDSAGNPLKDAFLTLYTYVHNYTDYYSYGTTDSDGRYEISYPVIPDTTEQVGYLSVYGEKQDIPDTTDFYQFKIDNHSLLLPDSSLQLDLIVPYKRYAVGTSSEKNNAEPVKRNTLFKITGDYIEVSGTRRGELQFFGIDGRIIHRKQVSPNNRRVPFPRDLKASTLLIVVYNDGENSCCKLLHHFGKHYKQSVWKKGYY